MAELKFKGKKMVWNHHLSVPYHTLDEVKDLGYKTEKADGNLIVEGDNLPALKSLLPQYAGKIKCIYIDPPYNTGNEGWVYNDNVNSPLIKEWLGKEVGSDDLTRHDKWLAMMTPRIKLLKELLADDGLIFISIDDTEMHRLRLLLDEIFDEENFVATFVWKTRQASGKQVTSRNISSEHEYLLCYQRFNDVGFMGVDRDKSQYSNPDNDPRGDWAKHPLDVGATKDERPNCYYELTDPETGIKYMANENRVWAFSKESMNKLIKEKKILFSKDGSTRPYLKKFFTELKSEKKPFSTWIGNTEDKNEQLDYLNVGYNTEGTKSLNALFDGAKVFDYPKPPSLVRELLRQVTEGDDIILDAFAGSGTTAQSVLELNDLDDGNRKFILVQMSESTKKEPKKNICRDITRERVTKVIEKLLKNKDIGFEYRKVGQAIDAETILSGELPNYDELAKYVFYLATGQTPKKDDIDNKKFLAGKVGDTSVYLLYKESLEELQRMALTHDFAKDLPKGKKIVYAPACFLDDDYLSENDIRFVSIPYNLFERPE